MALMSRKKRSARSAEKTFRRAAVSIGKWFFNWDTDEIRPCECRRIIPKQSRPRCLQTRHAESMRNGIRFDWAGRTVTG